MSKTVLIIIVFFITRYRSLKSEPDELVKITNIIKFQPWSKYLFNMLCRKQNGIPWWLSH